MPCCSEWEAGSYLAPAIPLAPAAPAPAAPAPAKVAVEGEADPGSAKGFSGVMAVEAYVPPDG